MLEFQIGFKAAHFCTPALRFFLFLAGVYVSQQKKQSESRAAFPSKVK